MSLFTSSSETSSNTLDGEDQFEQLQRSISSTTASNGKPRSSTSVGELVGSSPDLSLVRERAGTVAEDVRVTACNDREFIKNAYKYCSRCIGGTWSQISPEKFEVKYLSGGLTNYLYLCSLPEDITLQHGEPRQVLIRIYGEILDNKARFYEGVIFTLLSERGIGPKTFGVFHSGRIEEFLPYRHVWTRELATPHISRCIAQKAANYNCMKLPVTLDPTWMWENMERMLELALGPNKFDTIEEKNIYDEIIRKNNIFKEYRWLRKMLVDLESDVVFCHNDLQEGNIIYVNDEETGTIDCPLIDYEYSAYNYRGYDIANHFCEWMYEYSDDFHNGYKIYEDGWPTHEQQLVFANEYKATIDKIIDANRDVQDPRFLRNIKPVEVDRMLFEANRFALASHLFWALWSVVQRQISKIEFGFMDYGKARMDEYYRKKRDLGYKD